MQHSDRIYWIDNLKGLLLLFVIIEHIGYIPLYLKELVLFAGGLAMPGYFAISGYLFSTKRKLKVFFQQKTASLLIPYIAISIILVIFDHNLYSTTGINFLFENLHRIFEDGLSAEKGTPMWFVLTLYFICLFSYVWLKWTNKSVLILSVAIASGLSAWFIHKQNISTVLNYESLLAAYPYFLIGYIIRRKCIIEKIAKCRSLYLNGMLLILLSLLIMTNHFYDIGSVKSAVIPSLFIFYFYGIISIILTFIAFNRYIPKMYLTTFISLNGMTFLGFHAYIQLYTINILKFFKIWSDAIFYITLFISLITCYILCFITNKYCIKIIGKKESKLYNETFYNI